MKTILSSETMDIPDGVTIKVNAKVIEVEGPRGKLTRNFKHLNLDFQLIKDEETGKRKLRIEAWFGTRKTSAAIRTAFSHVENLITGVTKGYRCLQVQDALRVRSLPHQGLESSPKVGIFGVCSNASI